MLWYAVMFRYKPPHNSAWELAKMHDIPDTYRSYPQLDSVDFDQKMYAEKLMADNPEIEAKVVAFSIPLPE